MRHDADIAEGWKPVDASMLWNYNLHYFDFILQGGGATPEEGEGLIQDWVDQNPPGALVAWDPYPISLRIVNWVRFDRERRPLADRARESLAHQARWLNANLEHHILANHLFANAKALVFAGAFFEGKEANLWLRRGTRLLRREVAEQFLADGGHYERSPMYHAILTGDLLDIANLARCLPEPELRSLGFACREKALRALQWFSVMRHPDGRIPLFGDSAFDIGPDYEELLAYSERLGLETPEPRQRNAPTAAHLADSGFAVLNVGSTTVLANVGGVRADHQPGHTHSDTLSFELSIGQQRVIVDRGVSTYNVGERRLEERSAEAHNIMQIDDAGPNEVWMSFRVGRRARIRRSYAAHGPGAAIAEAVHDGYCYLRGVGLHCRRWELTHDALRIVDSIEGRGVRTLSFRLLLHPRITPHSNGNEVVLKDAEGQPLIQLHFPEPFKISIEPSSWSPRFNQQLPTTQIVAQARLALPYTSRVELCLPGQHGPSTCLASEWAGASMIEEEGPALR